MRIYYRLVRIYSRKLVVIHLLVLCLFFYYNNVSIYLSYLSFPIKTSSYIKKEKKKGFALRDRSWLRDIREYTYACLPRALHLEYQVVSRLLDATGNKHTVQW